MDSFIKAFKELNETDNPNKANSVYDETFEEKRHNCSVRYIKSLESRDSSTLIYKVKKCYHIRNIEKY